MSTIFHAHGTYNGKEFTVCYYHKPTSWDGLGCHTLSVQHLGYAIVGGVAYNGYTFGQILEMGAWGTFVTHGGGDCGIPLTILQSAVFADIMSRYTSYGVIVFSDRVNRGLDHSAQGYLPFYAGKWPFKEKVYFSCATLAKWLASHPEMGTLVAGPLMNNPNYQSGHNWGVCQVFMWHAKQHKIWTNKETGIIGPDVVIPSPASKEYSKITYDTV